MLHFRPVGLLLVLGVLLLVLAGCSTAPTTGSLDIAISGLPSGLPASVKVSSGSYSKTVTSGTTLSSLAPGTYTVTPQSVSLRRNVFDGSASHSTVIVGGGSNASVSVAYSVQGGDLWVADYGANSVDMFAAGTLGSTSSPAATIADQYGPTGLAFDASGNLWVANVSSSNTVNSGLGEVVEYTAASLTSGGPSPTVSVSSGINIAGGLAFDGNGNLWVSSYSGNVVVEYASSSLGSSSASPIATIATGISNPVGLAFDTSGNLWVANLYSGSGVNSGNGQVTEYKAGSLGSNPSPVASITTGLVNPYSVTFDEAGDLWVGNKGNDSVVRYSGGSLGSSPSPAATITTSAAKAVGTTLDVAGNLWVTHQSDAQGVEEYSGSSVANTGTPSSTATIDGFTNAQQSAFDPPPFNLPVSH